MTKDREGFVDGARAPATGTTIRIMFPAMRDAIAEAAPPTGPENLRGRGEMILCG